MAKRTTDAVSAPDSAQEAQDGQELQDVSRDTEMGESAEGTPFSSAEQLSRQPAAAQLEETEFIEYAVAAKGGLRLREEPSLDAPVAAVLPCGVGVLGNTRPAEDGWRQVFTGRLFGWVMDKFLEALELPELDHGTE